MTTRKTSVKKTAAIQIPGFNYHRPEGVHFDYIPSVTALESSDREPSIGYSMSLLDVLNCYCLATRTVVNEINQDVRTWFEKEADVKGWQKISWWQPGRAQAVSLCPKPKKDQPRV
jgi:hypothetical protein